ncbi:MAG: response regulator [Treponema sp.]|jgi:two-component system response regulator YesN|nr:response regulator [Treponema sp.]
MLKVLIVDDEPIIRAGIRRVIDWEKYGYEICGEAEDGIGAVQAVRLLRPDLTLLDIRLPGMSGIDVMRETADCPTKFLILSGYMDFEYACQALNMGAKGYIVKPLEEEILIEKITDIAEEISRFAEQEKWNNREAQCLAFARIMENHGKTADAAATIVKTTAVDLDRLHLNHTLCIRAQVAVLSYADLGVLEKELRSFFSNSRRPIFPYKNLMVILFTDVSEDTAKRFLEKFYDNLLLERIRAKKNTGALRSIAYSNESLLIALGTRLPPKDIGESFLIAEQLLSRAFFYRGVKCLCMDALSRNETTPSYPGLFKNADAMRSEELGAFIQIIDTEKICGFFKTFEEQCVLSGKTSREIREECISLILETRNIVISKFPSLKASIGNSKKILDAIMERRYLADIVDEMTRDCLNMSHRLACLSADGSFRRIISYVKNNYAQNLSLKTLGQLFHHNYAYLGKRFKEYTGRSFHTYLDILRVDAAKEMLTSSKMKVYEISSAVGYANTDYFYSKFRKYAGESPMEYKRRHAKTKDKGQ